MKKILLLSPPYVKHYMRNARCDFVSLSKTQWYPLWLGFLGCFLEKKGYEIKLVDAPAYDLSHKEAHEIIVDWKPDFLVVYTGRLSEDNDVKFSEKVIAELGIGGVYVGPYASIAPHNLLRKSSSISTVVHGEFEHAVFELVQGIDYSKIKNLIYLSKSGDIIENEQRPRMARDELDEIPFVSEFFSRHLDFKFYSTPSEFSPYLDIMTGRGCAWGHCTYCLWVHSFIVGSCYNSRSPKSVASEMKFIQEKIPHVRSVMIQDDTLTDERAKELSQEFITSNLKIKWSCYARGNLKYDTMVMMKKAGCRNVHVGFESANDNILKRIKKGITVERMTRFVADAKRAGLRIHGDFAIGFPGETIETAKRTIEWACKLRPHTAQFQLMIPFPGTPFFDELNEQGNILNGCANYPEASAEQLESLAKNAYKKYYISFWFLKQILVHPYELFFSRLKLYARAIPSLFWKKYVR